MTNKLCEAGCLGFPTSVLTGPSSPVQCRSDELVVPYPKIQVAARPGSVEVVSSPLTTGLALIGGYIQPTYTNPFEDQANVIVHHEFVMNAVIDESDQWNVYGDINITGSGATMYTGGTSATYQLEGNDGTIRSNDNVLTSILRTYSYTMWYLVPAGGVFSVGMQTRFTADVIRGASRAMLELGTAMTVLITPRKP